MTAEYDLKQKLKYVTVALFFGTFGLHRFMRHQYISATAFLVSLGVSVFFVGQPDKLSLVFVSLSVIAVLACIDAICMALTGRFYLDEKNVKIKHII